MPHLTLRIGVLVFLIFTFLTPVLASDMTSWISECERRNILQGCTCNCREDFDSSDQFELVRCSPNGFNVVDCPAASIPTQAESARFDSAGKVLVAGATVTDRQNELNFFPDLDKGVIVMCQPIPDDGAPPPSPQPCPLGNLDIDTTVKNFIRLIILIVGLVAIASIFYSFYLMITAQDDSEKMEQGRGLARNALFGFILAAVSYILVYVVIAATGFGNDGSSLSINSIVYAGTSTNDTYKDTLTACKLAGYTNCTEACTDLLQREGRTNGNNTFNNWPACDQRIEAIDDSTF